MPPANRSTSPAPRRMSSQLCPADRCEKPDLGTPSRAEMQKYAVLLRSFANPRDAASVGQSTQAITPCYPPPSPVPTTLLSCQDVQEIAPDATDFRTSDPLQEALTTTALPDPDSTLSPPTTTNSSSNSGPSSSGQTGIETVSSTSQITLATTSPGVEPASGPFRDPTPIPKCSPAMLVYPHSSEVIDSEFHSRFREVVNIFRENTEEHPRLREYVQHVDYALRMCGPSPETSSPSILVFCRPSEFSALKSLLTSKQLRFQYCLRRSSRKSFWNPWQGSQPLDPTETGKPLFNLYFWRHRRPKSLLWGAESRVCVCSSKASHLTMCGSVVTLVGSDTRTSTLGCVIQIGLEFYGITASHAVRPLEPHYRGSQGPGTRDGTGPVRSNLVSTESSDEFEATTSALQHQEIIPHLYPYSLGYPPEEDDYIMDDVEYDSLTDEDIDDEHETSDGFIVSPASISTTGDGDVGGAKPSAEVKEMLAMFPSQNELASCGELDLDWALIKLEDPGDWRPNAFVDPNKSLDPIFLTMIAWPCPIEETPVLILTREQSPKRGMLQRGASILGGINGNCTANIWTVILSERHGLKKGDSGSIVIDAQSYALYGLVVALNPLGEVYISPLVSVIDQIENRFRNSVVSLPRPMPTLSKLITFHIELRHSDTATELLGYYKGEYSPDAKEPPWKDFVDNPDLTIRNTVQSSTSSLSSLQESAAGGRATHDVLPAAISKMKCREQLMNVMKKKFKWQLDISPQGEDALADIMGRNTSFPIVWEHGVLPFLVEFLPRWCGPHHVISIIRGATSGSRRIYIMTDTKFTRPRRLIIAAHVRDLLPEQFLQTTTFAFAVGVVDRLTPIRSSSVRISDTAYVPKNPYYFSDPRMGDSIGIANGNGTEYDGTSTLGPCLVINGKSFRLGNLHPFVNARPHRDKVTIQHPSPSDRSRCVDEGHDDAIPGSVKCVLGTIIAASGEDLKTTRTSKNPYWEYCHLLSPRIVTDWILMTSETCKANILRRLPSDTLPSHKELIVRNTNAVFPGATVVSTGRTSGHRRGQVCEIPAYISAAGNGTDRATREWFIEDSTPYDDDNSGIYGAYGDSGAVVVDVESHALVGQLWGHSRCSGPGPRLTFFTAINDVFDDIEEKYLERQRPRLPQYPGKEDQFLPYPSCRRCYDLRTYVDSKRSARDPLRSMMMMYTTTQAEGSAMATPTGRSQEDVNSLQPSKRAAKTPTMKSSSLKTKKQRLD